VQKFFYPDKEELPDDLEMPIWDHLEELRERVFLSGIACILGILTCFVFSKELVIFLEAPVINEGVKFLQLSPGEYLFTTIQVSSSIWQPSPHLGPLGGRVRGAVAVGAHHSVRGGGVPRPWPHRLGKEVPLADHLRVVYSVLHRVSTSSMDPTEVGGLGWCSRTRSSLQPL